MSPALRRTAFRHVAADFPRRRWDPRQFAPAGSYLRHDADVAAAAFAFLDPRPVAAVFRIGITLNQLPGPRPPAVPRAQSPAAPGIPHHAAKEPPAPPREPGRLERLREIVQLIREVNAPPAADGGARAPHLASDFRPVALTYCSPAEPGKSAEPRQTPKLAWQPVALAPAFAVQPAETVRVAAVGGEYHTPTPEPVGMQFLAVAPLRGEGWRGESGAAAVGGWMNPVSRLVSRPVALPPSAPGWASRGTDTGNDNSFGAASPRAGAELLGMRLARSLVVHDAGSVGAGKGMGEAAAFAPVSRAVVAAAAAPVGDAATVAPVGGTARVGLTFATTTATRHSRSDTPVAAPTPVAMIVTAAPAGHAASSDAARPVTPRAAVTPAPVPIPQSPGGLPADLLQRLIEQVVRALDARALATRERFGRF